MSEPILHDEPSTDLRTYGEEGTIPHRIATLRQQMLVHGYIYYHLMDSFISDDAWQKMANELRDLQVDYKEPLGYYDEEFKDWTGDTGYHLPVPHNIRLIANRLKFYLDRRIV